MKYLLGYDIGSSSVKTCLLEIESGKPVCTAFSPELEMPIDAPQPGFAEQDPEAWWLHLCLAMQKLKQTFPFSPDEIAAIGISYQMHGLVVVNQDGVPLRSSIIWCDSRAVSIGSQAFQTLGEPYCLEHYLNSPGNFTASKLRWVQENQPDLYARIHKIMLPGDYIAYRLTGEMSTTISGLSEGIMWDFLEGRKADKLLDNYGIAPDLLPNLVPQFGEQGLLTASAAEQLSLKPGIPVTYRAGDQPNNAYSLKVLEPGEVAATAGTSGVVYGVTDKPEFDPQSRVNAFVHVNHSPKTPRNGILLCINGTGILNSWSRKHIFSGLDYAGMNALAAKAPIGADGLNFYPFGNGAERVLGNRDLGASMQGLQLNRHGQEHIARAVQEGIVCALSYGMDVMHGMGIQLHTVRAGHANMFLSPLFAQAFSDVTGCLLELYDTDGAQGAARGAGRGVGLFQNVSESHRGLHRIQSLEPRPDAQDEYARMYNRWKQGLLLQLGK